MNTICLKEMTVSTNRVDYFFEVTGTITKYFKQEKHLFLKYNHDISEVPKSVLTIPFVANVIPLIWATDSKLDIQELDSAFYQSLKGIKETFQKFYPKINFEGELSVHSLIENNYTPEHEAASFYSGGLDALTTYVRLKDKNPFLITEYGWHDKEIAYSEVWESDKENVTAFAQKNGLENILIESNYGTFMSYEQIDKTFSKKMGTSWWGGIHHGLAIISAGIPIAFKLKVDTLYIGSSGWGKNYCNCWGSSPETDNQIKYGNGSVFHDAFEMTRQDKLEFLINEYKNSLEVLPIRVCFKNDQNCCKCEKCMRTILGIVAEGASPKDYDFNIPDNCSDHVKNFLNSDVKFFTEDAIEYWQQIQTKMKKNHHQIADKELLKWFPDYDFNKSRKRKLIEYYTFNFFSILIRKLKLACQKSLWKSKNIAS